MCNKAVMWQLKKHKSLQKSCLEELRKHAQAHLHSRHLIQDRYILSQTVVQRNIHLHAMCRVNF